MGARSNNTNKTRKSRIFYFILILFLSILGIKILSYYCCECAVAVFELHVRGPNQKDNVVIVVCFWFGVLGSDLSEPRVM